MIFKRQTSGQVQCPSCHQPVEVQETACPHCGRYNPSLWGYASSLQKIGPDLGMLDVITWGCIGLFLLTLVLDIKGIQFGNNILSWLSPSTASLLAFGATGTIPVFKLNRWWTVLSAVWLHGSVLHITFNLLWIRHLAPAIAFFYGAGRLMIIFTLSGITGGILTSLAGAFLTGALAGAPLAVGASGGIFGLFGALASYGKVSQNKNLRKLGFSYAVIGFVYGVLVANVDNWGHLGGFLGGYFLTQLPIFRADRPEKHWHWLGAIACILLSLGSILLSLGHIIYLGSVGR